eukprot:4410852-Amphidinium_carterae.1
MHSAVCVAWTAVINSRNQPECGLNTITIAVTASNSSASKKRNLQNDFVRCLKTFNMGRNVRAQTHRVIDELNLTIYG